MTTPGRSLPAGWSAVSGRLGVLVVLAGVLAMHALAGGSHMAHMAMAGAADAGGQAAVSTAAGDPAGAAVAVLPGLNLVTATATATAVAGGRAVPQPGAAPRADAAPMHAGTAGHTAHPAVPGLGVDAACLAVLLGMVLIAARAAFGVPRLPRAAGVQSAGHSSARLGRGPPRQLLAQLCVLRT